MALGVPILKHFRVSYLNIGHSGKMDDAAHGFQLYFSHIEQMKWCS